VSLRLPRPGAALEAWRQRPTRWSRYRDPRKLADDHFRRRSSPDHVNYTSLRDLLELMGGRPQTILETGMSAWGTDSTRLFDSYVRSFGGAFWSVDIRSDPVDRLRRHVGPDTTLVCDDSVSFLGSWVAAHPQRTADVVYLDSWDVDFSDPLPAAEHCVRELRAVEPALRPGTLLLIDDSPGSLDGVPPEARDTAEGFHRTYGAWPGKGMLAHRELLDRGATVVHHRYQALYRV
jgi:hypothetical protein